MAETKKLSFGIDCEWLCNLIRERVYYEGLEYSAGLKLLGDSFGIPAEICDDILRGKKIIRGINEGELEDDDRYQEYQDYIKKQEAKAAKLAIQHDMLIHPLNYVDPFATCYSYWGFDKVQREKQKEGDWVCTIQDVLAFFEYHTDYLTGQINDQSGTYLKGGCYGLEDSDFFFDNGILKGPVESREELWDAMYVFFEKLLANDRWTHRLEKTDVVRRQNNHLAWKREQARKTRKSIDMDARIAKMLEDQKARDERKEKHERLTIDFYDYLYEPSEIYYIPTDKFSDYGMISPDGDFYACSRAEHQFAAFALAVQKGYMDFVEDSDDYGKAKDLLFERGWTFVNTLGHYGLSNKWHMDYEQMPQKAIDKCFDWQLWNREQDE